MAEWKVSISLVYDLANDSRGTSRDSASCVAAQGLVRYEREAPPEGTLTD